MLFPAKEYRWDLMSMTKIVGLMLVRNEDLYIEHAINGALGFCDEIIVADNDSKDRTPDIVKRMASKSASVSYHKISHPRQSHLLVETYAGTPTWIFAVDGDEIYDPSGLVRLKQELLAGKYDTSWVVFGNVLNCIELDMQSFKAKGYLSPPCRSMTKLYNFSMIESWTGCDSERLHDGTIVFKPGFNADLRLAYNEQHSWEESCFRCLHLCFLKRSSLDGECSGAYARSNIMDKKNMGVLSRIWSVIAGRDTGKWKRDKYIRGSVELKDVKKFFP